jgi:hypothetical protein
MLLRGRRDEQASLEIAERAGVAERNALVG